jgi:hypothetical protein
MPIIGSNASQAKQVRGISSSVALATGSSYTLPVATKAGDVIVFAYINAGAPTLTSSTTGITWLTQITTTGGATPRPCLLLGYNANAGITSITVSGTGAGAGGQVIAVISGLRSSSSPVVGTGTVQWSTTGGNTTPGVDTSTQNNMLCLGVSAQYGGAATPSGRLTSTGGISNYRSGYYTQRSIALWTGTNLSGYSSEQYSFVWSNSASGGGILVGLAAA